MPHMPSLFNLIAMYPVGSAESVAALVGGKVAEHFFDEKLSSYKNTCAIRVSRALNYAGDPIRQGGGGVSNPYMKDKKVRTDIGDDKMWYIYSTYDMRAYLTARYGKPKSFKGTSTKADLANVTGIIGFHFYHVDVWDGSSCAGHDHGFGNVEVKEIVVWPAK